MPDAVSFVFYSDGIKRLKVPSRILQELAAYEQFPDRKEKGGILLGFTYKDYDEILELSQPSKADKIGLFSFVRRKTPAQKKINKAWNESGGYLIYLGEWHTHPRNAPTPSNQDLSMIENSLKTTKMEIPYLYLVIAGTNNTIWIGRQEKNGLHILAEEIE